MLRREGEDGGILSVTAGAGREGGSEGRHTRLLTRATIMGRSAVGSRRCISCRCGGGRLLSLPMVSFLMG